MPGYKLIVKNAKVILKTATNAVLNISGIRDLLTGTSSVDSNNKINWTLQEYTDTAANFTSNNPVLLLGQKGIETDGLLTDPKFKIGDGVTDWNALPYFSSNSETTPTLQQTITESNEVNDGVVMKSSPTGIIDIRFNESTGIMEIGSYALGCYVSFDVYNSIMDLLGGSIKKNGVEVATITDVNNAIIGLLDDRGNYDASVNLFPSTGGSGISGAILKGDLWTISVAGTLGGVSVTVGDVVRALSDSPAQTSSNWTITENNLGYVPENLANKQSNLTASSTKYPTVDAVNTGLSLKLNANSWVDYSATSTIVGWSSFTIKSIFYIDMGAYYLYKYYLAGTSDATSTTFTLHVNEMTIRAENTIRTANNGVNGTGLARTTIGSNTVDCFSNITGAGYTASGSKTVSGTFIIMK